MPGRTREHELEDESITAFRRALTARDVYRTVTPDYGIDGEVEVFGNRRTTGMRYMVQLKGTDEPRLRDALKVPIPLDHAAYYGALPIPVLMVRYHAPTDQLYARWFHQFDSHRPGDRVNRKSLTFRWDEQHRWWPDRHEDLAAEARAFVRFTSSMLPLPLQVHVESALPPDAAPTAAELSIELRRAAALRPDIISVAGGLAPAGASRVVLEQEGLRFDLAGVTGATLHTAVDEVDVEQLAVEALVLVALALERVSQSSACGRLTASYLPRSVLADNAQVAVALSGEMARAGHVLPALDLAERLDEAAVARGELSESGFVFTLPALVRSDSLGAEEVKRYRRIMRRRIARRRSHGLDGAAGEYMNLANHHRNRHEWGEALKLYEQARAADPDYEKRPHWHHERAGALFGTGAYLRSAEAYGQALELGGNDLAEALAADALLFAGRFQEAREGFESFNSIPREHHREAEYRLKQRLAAELVDLLGLQEQRRQHEAAERLAGGVVGLSHEEGKRTCLQALALDGLSGLTHFNLAVSERELGETEAAARHFAAAGLVTHWDVEAWSQAAILQAAVSGLESTEVADLVLTGERLSGGQLLSGLRQHRKAGSCDAALLERALGLVAERMDDSSAGLTLRVLRAAEVEEIDVLSSPHAAARDRPTGPGRR